MEKFPNANDWTPESKKDRCHDILELGKGEGAQVESPMQNLGFGPDNKMIGPKSRVNQDEKKKSDFINY